MINEEGRRIEWKMVTEDRESINWSKDRWKREINSRVSGMGLEKWRQNIITKSTLLLYRGKEVPKRELFYDGSWRGDLLFRARTGSLEVNGRT